MEQRKTAKWNWLLYMFYFIIYNKNFTTLSITTGESDKYNLFSLVFCIVSNSENDIILHPRNLMLLKTYLAPMLNKVTFEICFFLYRCFFSLIFLFYFNYKNRIPILNKIRVKIQICLFVLWKRNLVLLICQIHLVCI